ncbi:MAG: AmmeMemoRadiSam system protein B [Planctomycetes bacterium]|nr:AmmeMemoRadiSam system protein B [Planctomycetota bacterium]
MRVREPAVAGQFYPGSADRCREEVKALLADALAPAYENEKLVGGLVPHAGWSYSGAIAAGVFRTLAASGLPDVIVLFGAVHRSRIEHAAVFGDGSWDTPIGSVPIDARLAERILGQTNLIRDDHFAHESEHSAEVQMPFIVELFPQAKVVPIMVPPGPRAPHVGDAVARTLSSYGYNALIVGTTDLTHYGPSYGFTPQGVDAQGIAWAKENNDRRLIEMICAMRGDQIVAEVLAHRNACGAGAIAATIAACAGLGATRGILLEHTTSAEIMAGRGCAGARDSVGYAGVVFA